MSKILPIDSCSVCKHRNERNVNGGFYKKEEDRFYSYDKYCSKEERFIDDISTFPDWCPLKDINLLIDAEEELKACYKQINDKNSQISDLKYKLEKIIKNENENVGILNKAHSNVRDLKKVRDSCIYQYDTDTSKLSEDINIIEKIKYLSITDNNNFAYYPVEMKNLPLSIFEDKYEVIFKNNYLNKELVLNVVIPYDKPRAEVTVIPADKPADNLLGYSMVEDKDTITKIKSAPDYKGGQLFKNESDKELSPQEYQSLKEDLDKNILPPTGSILSTNHQTVYAEYFEEKIYHIFESVNDLLKRQDYKTVKFILETLKPSGLSIDEMLSYLTITLKASEFLQPERMDYYHKVRQELHKRLIPDVVNILHGLL